MGARRIVVANVGPIGCIPFERDANGADTDCCIDFPNQMAQLYNTQLRSLVVDLGSSLEGSKFVYADVYRIVQDIIDNYISYGTLLHCNLYYFITSSFVCIRLANGRPSILNFDRKPISQVSKTQIRHAATLQVSSGV